MSNFAIAFILFFFGGILATLFYNGWVAFIVYEIVYFLNPDNRWWSAGVPGIRYSFITVMLMLLVYALNYRRYDQHSPWKEQACFKWMIILLALYYVAKLYALNPARHDVATFELTKLVIIMLIAYKVVDSRKAFDAVIWAYVVGAFYIGDLATSIGRNSGDRLEGIGMIDAPDANDTAAALVPAGVIVMYLAWQGGRYSRVFSVLMGAFIANGLVLINSRGAFLGVVASLGLFLMHMIFSKYQKKGQKGTAIMMIVFGLAGALYVADEVFWERMGTLKKSEDQEQISGSSRTVFWMRTFDMLESRPYGLGVWGYNELAPIYLTDEERGGVLNRAVHSTWFQAMSEIGYQGMLVFLLLLAALFRQSREAKKYLVAQGDFATYFKMLALECALIGYLVAATFIDRFRAEILYWMILFLAIAIKLYYLQPLREQSSAQSKMLNKRRGSVRNVGSE